MADWLGWLATAVFVGSYFAARGETIRRVQMIGALVWVGYGTLLGAWPVIAANVLVFGAAAWTLARGLRADRLGGGVPPGTPALDRPQLGDAEG